MDVHVLIEVGLVCVCFATDMAEIKFLTGVGELVSIEVGRV